MCAFRRLVRSGLVYFFFACYLEAFELSVGVSQPSVEQQFGLILVSKVSEEAEHEFSGGEYAEIARPIVLFVPNQSQ
jgi:hypothetical protein